MEPTPTKRDDLSLIAVIASMVAVLIAVVGVGFGLRAVDEAKTDVESSGAISGGTADLSLAEFAITPGAVEVAAGGTIRVTNDGKIQHNLAIEGTELVTEMLDPGAAGTLAIGDLPAGTYAISCTIPGHKEAGMTAELSLGGGGGGAQGAGAGHDAMSADEMDEVMHDVVAKFPAETAGVGGQPLAPTVLPDGTKRFDLTAKIVDWEVEPGRVVKAWTYNGTVPGPTMKVASGDRIQVVLQNDLPESTAIHFHGLRTPNAMDGVPDITQPPIKPGAAFTYEFVARGPAVGMYHSHHNAAEQVPNGLAGTILVGDLPLPTGVSVADTHSMMLNDAGVIGYSLNGKSFPATKPVSVGLGQWVLMHYLNEGVQGHPMHLHGFEQLVIAKDGIPLAEPYAADTINVAPGERYSVLVHADEKGVWAWHCHILPHAERDTGMFGMVTAMIVA